jgi:hypothetical protein
MNTRFKIRNKKFIKAMKSIFNKDDHGAFRFINDDVTDIYTAYRLTYRTSENRPTKEDRAFNRRARLQERKQMLLFGEMK